MPAKNNPEERAFSRRLGSSLQRARLERDVSQESLAEAVGTSTTTIGRWERGINPPKSYQLAKIWAFLNGIDRLDAVDLFDPPDDLSDLDRRQMERAALEGVDAAWRPRRRATRRVGLEGVQQGESATGATSRRLNLRSEVGDDGLASQFGTHRGPRLDAPPVPAGRWRATVSDGVETHKPFHPQSSKLGVDEVARP